MRNDVMANYRDLLARIRLAFPQPISDRVHDSYFVHSIMRAVDQVDSLKTVIPSLGVAPPNDYGDCGKQTEIFWDEECNGIRKRDCAYPSS